MHQVHQAKLQIYDAQLDENETNWHEIIIKF